MFNRHDVDRWLGGIVERWRSLRPHVPLATRIDCGSPAPQLVADATLEQAIHNLINNAADASPVDVECTARIAADTLLIEVLDRGAGMPGKLTPIAGRQAVDSARGGLGIGLLLAFGAVERCGGRIEFSDRPGGGTIATLSLPLSALRP